MKSFVIAASAVVLTLVAVFALKRAPAMVQPKPEVATVADPNAALKQLWTCGMHPQVIQDHPGICPICHMKLTPLKTGGDNAAGGGKKIIAYWWDPMIGSASISNHPGKSAMGMDLVPVNEDQMSAGPSVRIDPAVVQNMGMVTVPVVRGPLTVTVRAVGTIEVPEPGLHDITLKINGYIQKLYANTEGMNVAKGDVLFDLYSPDLQLAEQELITARQNIETLDPAAGEVVRKDAQNLFNSSKEKLRLWDVAEPDIDAIAAATQAPKTVPFRSPADGHVMDKMVVNGSAVQAGMKVMRIEDHSMLWLNVQVYEDQIPLVMMGEKVNATVDGIPGKTFISQVMFIFPHVDPMARTETVRALLDNRHHELNPGMYASAEIITQPLQDAILAPREAVIDTGTQQIVFVMDPTSAGHFQPRKVRMGMAGDNDKVQIVEGLAPGDQVVTSGQFLMDVESRTTEAIDKLRSANAAATRPAPGSELIHSTSPAPEGQP